MSKMPFKVLLCGGSGMLGQELLHSIPDGIDVWAPSSTELDIRQREVVMHQAAAYQPDLIINAAAYTDVDGAETNAELAFAINCNGPENLGIYAAQANIPVFHISTDYVFDGTKGTPYTEEDEPNPINVYGKSKLAGERALQRVCAKSLILRTSWLFSVYGDCFCRRFITLMYQHERVYVVNDQYSAMTRADLLAEFIWCQAAKAQQGLPMQWEVVHCSGTEQCNKYEVIQRIFTLLSNAKKPLKCESLTPVAHTFFLGSASRPRQSVLGSTSSSTSLSKFGSIWDEGASAIIMDINNQINP